MIGNKKKMHFNVSDVFCSEIFSNLKKTSSATNRLNDKSVRLDFKKTCKPATFTVLQNNPKAVTTKL